MAMQSTLRSLRDSVTPLLLSFGLLIVLVGTRSQFVAEHLHFAPWLRAPDATLAVFFLAGMWIRSIPLIGVLLAASALADQLAFANGVSDWCVTAAYACLIPAYLVMWYSGRYCRDLSLTPKGIAKFAGVFLIATWIEFVISNHSFFLFSGYFPNMSTAEYWSKTIRYYPLYLEWAAIYVVAGMAIVSAITPLRNYVRQQRR